MIRGNKKVIALRIKDKTIYVELFKVNAIALKYFAVKFEESNKETQAFIKEKIREICKELELVTTQTIEHQIFLHFLPKNIKERLTNDN